MMEFFCNFLLRIRVKATASSPKSKRFKTYNSSSFFSYRNSFVIPMILGLKLKIFINYLPNDNFLLPEDMSQ